jgi:hypothetical protein
VLDPPAEVTRTEVGLTFTTVLFGFVIWELFRRIGNQNWTNLRAPVQWQLAAGVALLLGSWIGFSQSAFRSRYRLKFFNLPLIRFVLDQGMVILYFRIAVLTPADSATSLPVMSPETLGGVLTNETLKTLALIFVLYGLWDLLGIWMARAGPPGPPDHPKYPRVEDDPKVVKKRITLRSAAPKEVEVETLKADERAPYNWGGLVITGVFLGAVLTVLGLYPGRDLSDQAAVEALFAATALLVLYRVAKELRSSWKAYG